METIIINGVTCIVSTATADQYRREVAEERETKRRAWFIWHWYARRWALYGDEEAGAFFSDLYKDEYGCRPHMSKAAVLRTLDGWSLMRRWW